MKPQPYLANVVFNETLKTTTLVYADSQENAWLLASKQFGAATVLSVRELKATPFWKAVFSRKSSEQ